MSDHRGWSFQMGSSALFLLCICLAAATRQDRSSLTGRRENRDDLPPVFRFRRTERGLGRKANDDALTFIREKREAGRDESEEEAPFKDREDYDSFFRNEYYRILAQSFASSRRKREAKMGNLPFSNLVGTDLDRDYDSEEPSGKLLKKSLRRPAKWDDDQQEFWNEFNQQETGLVPPRNAGFRPLPGFSARPILDSDLPFEKWKIFHQEKYDEECPPLYLIAKECAALGENMPEGSLKNILLRACNWLEICYSCGKSNGLQLDDCDTGFLYGIRSVCEGDIPCQATGRLLLLSLRQTGVSQRSPTSVCNVDRCIEQFLLQPSP